jgi:ABC-type hemin transport system substrate-binding protein
MRIVSLAPSVTETLSAWDRSPIACSRFCERPDLLHVGGTKNPRVDDITELQPDLVVLDAEENRREDHDALVAKGIDVHVLHIRSVADVGPGMASLAQRVDALGRTAPP